MRVVGSIFLSIVFINTKFSKLFAVDPSLTCSGWALYCFETNTLIGIGKLKSLAPNLPLERRLQNLQERITVLFKDIGLSASDYLVIEAPTTMKDPKAVLKVERVRSIFESVARINSLTLLGRINPKTVQKDVLGLSGKQLAREIIKSTASRMVEMLYKKELTNLGFKVDYDNLIRNQDIVDAILIGRATLYYAKECLKAGSDPTSIFEWQQRTTSRANLKSVRISQRTSFIR